MWNNAEKLGIAAELINHIYALASLFSLNDAIPGVAVSDYETQAIVTQLNSDWIVSQTTVSLARLNNQEVL